ncbi:LacI family DNA-binding transcriptional regulator [Cellulomonas edaphi]|uniref:LacI family DNA-binding transcriptional regulator n=1 Tax=Cellulomonas edaphi TaxID=3053468 RepID=A0ABT7S2K5_9CELL|nr:LacI family DNA-binding transcriptional regulator [Cellulomons edaphi]MDM7829846.1 LacI family DNA-binding transcriptional regulator [Cellulomons edaphi]
MAGTDVPEREAITLSHVAQRAGVSLKTASRALNGEQHVATATRERVLAAAADLDFRMNPQASMLKRGIATPAVGMITGDLANPFYSALAKGVEKEVRAVGAHLTIASSDEDPDVERDLVREFADRHVRGLVIASTRASHEDIAVLIARGTAVVFVDRPPVGVEADSIVIDNYGGAYTATQHLLAVGHRHIAFVGDYERLSTHRERRRGYTDALAEAGCEPIVRVDSHDMLAGRDTVTELLTGDQPVTAVLAGNNRIALGAVRAIAATRPEVALVGFDDFDLSDVLGVTTVAHDATEMGRLAAQRILERTGRMTFERVVMPTRLIERGSGEKPPPA